MKTTVEIADDLLARARQVQQDNDLTLRSLVEEGLRMALQRREKVERKRFKLVVFKGTGMTEEAKEKGWPWIREIANER